MPRRALSQAVEDTPAEISGNEDWTFSCKLISTGGVEIPEDAAADPLSPSGFRTADFKVLGGLG